MTKAIIVFADGSKQMAHNLDDLRFRWYEQKTTRVHEIENGLKLGIVIPQLDDVDDIDALAKWRLVLLTMLGDIKRQQIQVGKRWSRIVLEDIRNLIDIQLGRIKVILKQEALKNNNGSDESIRKQNHQLKTDLISAQNEIIRLQRLLIDQFILPPEIVVKDYKVEAPED